MLLLMPHAARVSALLTLWNRSIIIFIFPIIPGRQTAIFARRGFIREKQLPALNARREITATGRLTALCHCQAEIIIFWHGLTNSFPIQSTGARKESMLQKMPQNSFWMQWLRPEWQSPETFSGWFPSREAQREKFCKK